MIENIELSKNDLSIYPNPTEGKTYLSFYLSNKETIHISIYDIAGRLLINNSLFNICGNQKIELNFIEFSKGMYIIKTIIGNFISNKKVIVH